MSNAGIEPRNVALCAAVFLTLRKRRVYDAIERRRRLRAHRERDFRRRQSRQRMMFAFLLSDNSVTSTIRMDDWLENLRMSKATFLYVCSELCLVVEKNDSSMRKAIPVEQRVALTLWFLATGTDFRTIGHLFGVSKSTVCVVTKQVCNALVSILLPKNIRFPSGDGLREVVDGFKHKFGFPQCAGVVDGTRSDSIPCRIPC